MNDDLFSTVEVKPLSAIITYYYYYYSLHYADFIRQLCSHFAVCILFSSF